MAAVLSVRTIPLIGEVEPGMPLAALFVAGLRELEIALLAADVLVVAQKIVSKSEGRFVDLRSVTPGAKAREIAAICAKDPRLVEVILSESAAVIRVRRQVLIVRHRLGFIMANAGVDHSNVREAPGEERVLLLPADPDASAKRLRADIRSLAGTAPGVIISDSFGRPWRLGTVNVAIGAAGVCSLWDRRGEADRGGRKLEVTQVAVADALAAAAGLAMGEAAEGTPAVVLRGFRCDAPESPAASLLRPADEDLFL